MTDGVDLHENTTGLASARPASASVNETLRIYRDDGVVAEQLWGRLSAVAAVPVATLAVGGLSVAALVGWRSMAVVTAGVVWFVVLGLLSGAGRESANLQWLVPAFLRIGEYGGVIVLAQVTGAPQPAAYGLLAAVAFHHYDLVYRLRHQLVAPPRWVDRAGGGWELRVVALLVAAYAGILDVVMIAVGMWCGALYLSESITSWIAVARDEQHQVEIDIDDEEAEAL